LPATISRPRIALGLLGGAAVIASSAAHSLLGWKALDSALDAVQAPPAVIRSLSIGWHFAGVAMLAFGVIVVRLFADRLRGRVVSLWPVRFIAVVYLAFGAWALAVSELDPFFMVFIGPGLVMLAAAWGSRRE
jgi:hypothetical protein